jgi:hypothetical protein
MEIPKFIGDERKDEINPMELLRLVNKYDRNHLTTRSYFLGEAHQRWMRIDFDIRWNITWEEFEEIFSNKWIRDAKMEAMYKIQEDLKV